MNNSGFSGTTRECLENFRTIQPERAEETENLAPPIFGSERLAAFHKWLNNGAGLPSGEDLIRLRYLLDALGYKVEELEQLPTTIRN